MRIVFATNNQHKLSEIRSILGDSIEVLSLKDIGCDVDIPETGTTLEENALQKAKYVYDNYHIDCFADDTGLEVDALGGAPGVYSARYASLENQSNQNTQNTQSNPISHDSEANMARLLKELGNNNNRRARFRTVIALIQTKNVCPCGCTSIKDIHQFEGIVEGQIIRERRGGEGFGYDPIFQPDGYDKTFAELGMEIKNHISHRARAVQKLAEFLRILILLFTFHYSLFTFSQVGTWKNYLAYHEVQDIQKADDYLFVLASNGLYQYNLNDQSIFTYDRTNGLSDTHITHIAWSQQAKRLIAVYENSNIDLVDTNGNVTNISALYSKSTTEDKTVTDVRIDGIYAWLVTGFAILKVNLQKAEIADTYTPNHPEYPKSLPEKSTTDYEKYISIVSALKPLGPDYNHFYEAKFLNGCLYTTGGFFISGMPDPVYPGIIQVYDGNDWTTFEENISEKTGYSYIDINCLDVMPDNPQHVVAGGRTGMYEFINGLLVRYHNQDNSPLRGAIDRGNMLDNNYTLISTMKFDNNGHLWVLNNQTEGVTLLEYDPADNKWTDHHNKVLTNENGIGKHAFRSMIIDSRGLLWFVNDNWVQPAVFCCDMNNNIVVKYDDFVNQDGTRYNINWITCVCEDKEGNIWVGTDVGPFMIQKSEVGESSVTFYQVKIPRNDGSNLADYLLSGVSISSIAIDGGNRKWFGSDNAGAFLISANNMEQIHSFNTGNSKLISDNIASIAINPVSGEVFFLSDYGLCSYMSDATEAQETMDSDNVYAYPNPVTPDYTGLITVTGLSYDADVKVTASNGALIAEGRSNGGMFTWDGCDRNGKRVASGVYMVITATRDGKKGTVCKIAVIN